MPGDGDHRDVAVELDRAVLASLERAARRVPDAAGLVAELRRLVAAGGKRLRPELCYWAYVGCGGAPSDEIVRAAASLELLHTFAIVHDDIMDGAERRRGAQTINARLGTNVALLAGDLALVLADEELTSSGFTGAALEDGFRAYSRMRQEVVAGQYLELSLERSVSVAEEDARRVAILKSGRYSVREPLLIGAALAEAGDELVAALDRAGEALGLAFQLADDLLGTFGDPTVTGKPADLDIRSGKRNVLFARTVASLRGSDRDAFLERWGGGDALDDDGVALVRALVERSGARATTEAERDRLAREAVDEIGSLELSEDARDALLGLASRLTERAF